MSKKKDFSEEYFNSDTRKPGQYKSYDRERFYPAFGSMVKALKKTISAENVLDVGCAKGFLVDVLASEGYNAFGIDISRYAIENGPESVKSCLNVCDLNCDIIPYEDSVFDLLICMGTLEYVENQEKALSEMRRVLKKGGLLLMTTLNSVPEGDEYRKFARKENEWDKKFKEYGFFPHKELANKIFPEYIRKINLYDIGNTLKQKEERSLKILTAKLIFKTPARHMVIRYLSYRQVRSGYLMLCYQKN